MDMAAEAHARLQGEFDSRQRLARGLDGIRSDARSRWPEWTALGAYAALVALAIPYHEPWVDEAQAWQLARSLSLASLFKTFIRYEGSPGLWHFLLWAMNRVHIGYGSMHWISGGIATAGVSLLIFKSPLSALPEAFFSIYLLSLVSIRHCGAQLCNCPPTVFSGCGGVEKKPAGRCAGARSASKCCLAHGGTLGGLAAVYAIEQIRNREGNLFKSRSRLLLCTVFCLPFTPLRSGRRFPRKTYRATSRGSWRIPLHLH